MSTNNKKLYALIVALFLGIVTIVKKAHDHKLDKHQKSLQRDQLKMEQILKELQIETNFMLNVAYLKYKDKALIDKDVKKQQLLDDFKSCYLEQFPQKYMLTYERFGLVLQQSPQLETQYMSLLRQFDKFKDSKPQPLDIHLSKFNSQSLKVILKKYLAYIRYLTFTQTNKINSYMQRFDHHIGIITNETHLKEVFSLFIMSFEDQHPEFDRVQGAYFREFKKAYYQLLFDKQWCDEILEMELQHLSSVSLIVELAHQIKGEWFNDNPLERRQPDFGIVYELPQEITLTMSQKTKDQIRLKYMTLTTQRLSTQEQSILVSQVFNINPMLVKLRQMRDKMSQSLTTSKQDKSQDSGSFTSNSNSVKNQTKRKMPNYVPLQEKLKKGLSGQIQPHFNNVSTAVRDTAINSMMENVPLVISEKYNSEEQSSILSKSSPKENKTNTADPVKKTPKGASQL